MIRTLVICDECGETVVLSGPRTMRGCFADSKMVEVGNGQALCVGCQQRDTEPPPSEQTIVGMPRVELPRGSA